MRRLVFIFFLPVVMVLAGSCGNKKGSVLTERIQYDVTITSPEKDLEWWVQNLENNKREIVVKSLVNVSKAGKNKVYDVLTYKEMTAEQIEERCKRKELMTLTRDYPPYEEFDTLVTNELQLSDITKIRFLEEWYLNEETGMITKKVIGMCPMLESYTESGELRGHLPLFWISYVKNFPLAAK